MKRSEPEEEVHVTPGMVRQGVAALEEFSGSYGAVQLVEAVYTAMALAWRSEPRRSDSSTPGYRS